MFNSLSKLQSTGRDSTGSNPVEPEFITLTAPNLKDRMKTFVGMVYSSEGITDTGIRFQVQCPEDMDTQDCYRELIRNFEKGLEALVRQDIH